MGRRYTGWIGVLVFPPVLAAQVEPLLAPPASPQELVSQLRRGAHFRIVESFLVDGRMDREAFLALRSALVAEPDTVREQVAKALALAAEEADPLRPRGGRLVRSREILSTLVEQGLANRDTARDFSIETLLEYTPAEALEPHESTLVENLKKWPDSKLLLLIAKGKFASARPVLEELLRLGEWAEDERAWVAAAALGDTAAERRFVEPFLETADPAEKARLARLLGYIGTERALSALAGQMRTDLIYAVEGGPARSVRVDIMQALRHNFPEETALYDRALLDPDVYDRVERFCEERLGIAWQTPRPPFLTIAEYPHRAEK